MVSSKLQFSGHSARFGKTWGCSSVGRAVALQAIGQEFESPQLHQTGILSNETEFVAAEIPENGPVAQLVRACA